MNGYLNKNNNNKIDDMRLTICISRCIDFVRDRPIRPFNALLGNKDSLHSVWRCFLLIRKCVIFENEMSYSLFTLQQLKLKSYSKTKTNEIG